jgi:hypothetical protein
MGEFYEEESSGECPHCGALNDIEEWVDGECERCNASYHWQEYPDPDNEDSTDVTAVIIWE